MSDHQTQYTPASSEDLARLDGLGRFLEQNRVPEKADLWRKFMFGVLGLLVLLSLFAKNHHPHFVVDEYFGFWPAFGLIVGVVMVFFVKKIVQPLIKRPEDYYADL